ncbi:uncharacterized protein LOC144609280 [Rhinoraja longicauda]
MEVMPFARVEGTEGSTDRLLVGGGSLGGGRGSWQCLPSPDSGRLEAEGDGELTSLNWLHEGKNLLGGMRLAGVPSVDPLPARGEPQENDCPPLSVEAEGTSQRHLPVKEIYKWILQQYPCLKRTPRAGRNQSTSPSAGRSGERWNTTESSSTTDRQNTSYNQCTDGPVQDQLPASGIDQGNTSTLLPVATDVTSSGEREPAQTHSRDPAPGPVWASISIGDHNYSLAGGIERQSRVPESDGTFSAGAGRGGGDDGSEGFASGGESEDEGAGDSLADSGYVPLCAAGIDEELREVAGSLLNLAGIHR